MKLEDKIKQLLQYYEGELNDELTRNEICKQLFKLFVSEINEPIKIVCDDTNNTPKVIDQRRLIADIYFNAAV